MIKSCRIFLLSIQEKFIEKNSDNVTEAVQYITSTALNWLRDHLNVIHEPAKKFQSECTTAKNQLEELLGILKNNVIFVKANLP